MINGRARLGLLALGAFGLLALGGSGYLEPEYHLGNGRSTRSWMVAKASGEMVIDVSPSAGWLKPFAGLAAIGLCAYALRESEKQQHADGVELALRESEKSYLLEQRAVQQQARLTTLKAETELVESMQTEKRVAKLAASGALPQSEIVNDPPKPQKYSAELPNFAQEFGENPKSAMIVGVPGAGKGVFVSNAIRYLKAQRPDIYILGVDPKNDPKETGYWEQGFDKVIRFDQKKIKDSDDLLSYLERIIDNFMAIEGPKLWFLDEMTIMCRRCKNGNKKRYSGIVDYWVGISSSGDSREEFFWGAGQTANTDDYGFGGGVRSLFKPVAIVSKTDVAASKQLLGTEFAPTDDKKSTLEMMDYSPVDRAIYWYPDGQWYPMPKMTNYSGHNRDKRQQIRQL